MKISKLCENCLKEAYDWFASEHNLNKLDETQRTEAWQKYAIKLKKKKHKA